MERRRQQTHLGRVLRYVFLFMFVAAAAWAGTATNDQWVTARKRSSTAAPSYYRTAVAGADSTVTTVPINLQSVFGGDTTLVVSLGFTNNAAVATVECWVYGASSTFLYVADVQTQTATARSDLAGTTFYAVRPTYFPLNGATSYDVRITSLSAGTVSVMAYTIGSASIAAE